MHHGFDYTDVGHSTNAGPVVAWWIDATGRLRSRACRHARLHPARSRCPTRIATRLRAAAVGRLELDRGIGSVQLAPQTPQADLHGILERLDARYPGIRWFVFNESERRSPALAAH